MEEKNSQKENPEEKSAEKDLAKCREQAEGYLNSWKRERADFLNYKKDESKRFGEFLKFANEGIVMEIIEALDDLEIAVKEIKNPGLDQAVKKVYNLLTVNGVERIKTEGEKFNPEFHEVVISDGDDNIGLSEEINVKMEEIRAGYVMHGKVIRPARVKIVK